MCARGSLLIQSVIGPVRNFVETQNACYHRQRQHSGSFTTLKAGGICSIVTQCVTIFFNFLQSRWEKKTRRERTLVRAESKFAQPNLRKVIQNYFYRHNFTALRSKERAREHVTIFTRKNSPRESRDIAFTNHCEFCRNRSHIKYVPFTSQRR